MSLDLDVSIVFSAFYIKGYYGGKQPGLCRHSRHVIRSLPECMFALKKLGINASEDRWAGLMESYPSGCNLKKDKKKVYFEKSIGRYFPKPNRNVTDFLPICKIVTDSGCFVISYILI